MPMVAKQAPYTLFIVEDNDARSPREENDNFGTMVAFHKRYNLGDERKYSEPEDFLRDLCYDTVPSSEVVALVAENKLDYLRFEPDEEDKAIYYLKSYDGHYKKWYTEDTFVSPLSAAEDEAANSILEWTKISDLVELAKQHNVILPVYLYDHSGLTINTTGFSCPWDSGQLGWIYATHRDIKEEYGEVTPETLTKAESLLQSEIEEYDLYLTGQCYGFKLYEGHNEINSCWGFLSAFSDIGKQIREHLPDNCRDIVDLLEYQPDRIDEDEYLENEDENEDDLER